VTEKFNTSFTSVFSIEDMSYRPEPKKICVGPVAEQMTDIVITEEMILSKL